MTEQTIVLVSHHLCPYVQRAAIALVEKSVPFKRININLSNKPDWFLSISPLGKTPVLRVANRAIFESAVILEYLEETQPNPMHPSNLLDRADHRAWMEFGSSILNDISGFYNAPDEVTFQLKTNGIAEKLTQIEHRLDATPFFAGVKFSLVDAVYGPVFRYLDVFDQIADFGLLTDRPKTKAWRTRLTARPSVRQAVGGDYNDQLWNFLLMRNSHLTKLIQAKAA